MDVKGFNHLRFPIHSDWAKPVASASPIWNPLPSGAKLTGLPSFLQIMPTAQGNRNAFGCLQDSNFQSCILNTTLCNSDTTPCHR